MTYEQIYEKAKIETVAANKDKVLEDNYVVTFSPGHTRAVSKLDKCHDVIKTAEYYASLKAADSIDTETGMAFTRLSPQTR